MIGIIIGIASVITIMSLGNGFKNSTNEQFNDAGAGKNQASISYMTENMEAPKNNPFKQEDISVVEQVDGVKSAKVKEDKDSTYTVKITNTHGSEDASLKKVDKLTDIDEGKHLLYLLYRRLEVRLKLYLFAIYFPSHYK